MKRSDHAYSKARQLRQDMSLPERLLWRELRAQRGGVKIRRQHPIGPYVIDFYCASAKHGFEIDGIVHDMGDRRFGDEVRDLFLAKQGVTVTRFPAAQVLRNVLGTAQTIAMLCGKRS